MPNETVLAFGYPDSVLKDYTYWVVMLRPKQVTVGSLVLACKENATCVPEVSAGAFAELKMVSADLEQALAQSFAHDKINYLLLMMVDKYVHFHVLPRYATGRNIMGTEFVDSAWPGPPDIKAVLAVDLRQWREIRDRLRDSWP